MQRTKLSSLATFNMGQSPSSSLISEDKNGTPFLQGNADFGLVHPGAHLYCHKPLKTCEKDDILISVRAPVGDLNKADQVYCIGRGLAAIRFGRASPGFGWYLLNYWAKDLNRVAQGSTFEAISRADLENLTVSFAEDEEQYYITTILDTLDARIQASEKLVTKLKLVQTGLIQTLLTRGIDENGEMRDPVAHPEQFEQSPLGRMPEKWMIRKLKYFYSEPARTGLYKSAKYYGKGHPMIHMPQMFRGLVVDTSDSARVDVTVAEQERFSLKPGDLVFARRSLNFDGAGRCLLVPELVELTTFESSIIRVRLSNYLLRSSFANLFLNSDLGLRQRVPLIRQVAVSGVSSEDIASILVPCPPIEEQDIIIQLSQTHCTRVAVEESYLAKLRLLKQGLMHDLLTGHVRVTELNPESKH